MINSFSGSVIFWEYDVMKLVRAMLHKLGIKRYCTIHLGNVCLQIGNAYTDWWWKVLYEQPFVLIIQRYYPFMIELWIVSFVMRIMFFGERRKDAKQNNHSR